MCLINNKQSARKVSVEVKTETRFAAKEKKKRPFCRSIIEAGGQQRVFTVIYRKEAGSLAQCSCRRGKDMELWEEITASLSSHSRLLSH